MTADEQPPLDSNAGDEKWAGGIWSSGRWRLHGAARAGATRVEVRGAGAVYRAPCVEGRWEVMLPEAEQAAVVTVAAIARDGRVVARDECIVAAPEPPRGLRRWLRRRPAGTSWRARGRGSVTYGPGSVR